VPQTRPGQDDDNGDFDDDDEEGGGGAIDDIDRESSRSTSSRAISSTGKGERERGLVEVEVEVRTSRVRLSVREGKYRMVRRILHNAGHSVLQLHRLRYGNLFLGDVEEGEVRPCNSDEKAWALSVLTNASKKKGAAP
jgi:16S rRNA U516 pseudouridylate synthase RsuA-like enzyme